MREDPTIKAHLRCVQIKGPKDDDLLIRLEKYAAKIGIAQATAARILLRKQLDIEERTNGK